MMQGSWNGLAQMNDPKDDRDFQSTLETIIRGLAEDPELVVRLMREVQNPQNNDRLWGQGMLPGESPKELIARVITLAKNTGRFIICDKSKDTVESKIEVHREIIQKLRENPAWFFALYALFSNFAEYMLRNGEGNEKLDAAEMVVLDIEIWRYIQYQFDLMIIVGGKPK